MCGQFFIIRQLFYTKIYPSWNLTNMTNIILYDSTLRIMIVVTRHGHSPFALLWC